MATPVINNGLFLRDTEYKVTSSVDSFHLLNMVGETKPTDLGVVDLWAMAQKVEMPLYQMANFNGQNTIEVDHPKGEFKWQIPVVQDLPYIVEDIEPGNIRLGEDGTTFQVKVNKRAFGHGDLFTYDKYNGAEMYVTDADIIPTGDGFVYTVQLPNNDNLRFLDKKYLKPGQKLFSKGSAKSVDYGEKYADLGEMTAGFREFYNFVGGAEAHVHYHISTKADLMLRGGLKANGAMAVTEIWKCFDRNIDPSIADLDSLVKKMGKDYIKRAYEEGTLTRSFVTNLESACLTKIGNDIESYLMWGHGGNITGTNGPDDIRLTVGLWKQLDNSFKKIYNKHEFSLDMFRSEIFNFYNGKVEFKGPDPKREIIVQTGLAGMKLVSEAIKREALGAGLVTQSTEIGAISGSAMDLNYGFAFTRYTIPYLANVKFVLNPAFDNIHTSDLENPIIDGYPLSSYNFIIFDITDNTNDNIFLLKKKWDHELRWHYLNGTMDYMGRTKGFQASGQFTGYKVFMSQAYPAIWVKDPTKVLKMVMRNPITGGSF